MKNFKRLLAVLLILAVTSLFSACSEGGDSTAPDSPDSADAAEGTRESLHEFLLPEATGAVAYGNESASIDASNTSEGYVMISYTGAAQKAKVQITDPSGTVYTYTILVSSYQTFPLSGGNGSYHIDVLENVQDDLYAMVFSQDIEVTIADEFKPFLYPNQYSWFTADMQAIKLGIELSDSSSGDLDFVGRVYTYVTENISYDMALAADVPLNYIPDIDTTLSKKTGICFDYASLMTALLRSQGVPTKLEVGYSGTAYHAWISVYLEETGWVNNIIEFDGNSWSLMDPTLGSNNDNEAVGQYIGDGTNYMVKYHY